MEMNDIKMSVERGSTRKPNPYPVDEGCKGTSVAQSWTDQHSGGVNVDGMSGSDERVSQEICCCGAASDRRQPRVQAGPTGETCRAGAEVGVSRSRDDGLDITKRAERRGGSCVQAAQSSGGEGDGWEDLLDEWTRFVVVLNCRNAHPLIHNVLQRRFRWDGPVGTIPDGPNDLFEDMWMNQPTDRNFLLHRMLVTVALMQDYAYNELLAELYMHRDPEHPVARDEVASLRLAAGKLLTFDGDQFRLFHDRFRRFLVGEQPAPLAGISSRKTHLPDGTGRKLRFRLGHRSELLVAIHPGAEPSKLNGLPENQ